MVVIYVLICVIAGPEVGAQFSNGSHYLVFSFIQGVTVAAGLFVLITGVKLFLAELLPAFKVFAEKIVHGAVAAVDSPFSSPIARNQQCWVLLPLSWEWRLEFLSGSRWSWANNYPKRDSNFLQRLSFRGHRGRGLVGGGSF